MEGKLVGRERQKVMLIVGFGYITPKIFNRQSICLTIDSTAPEPIVISPTFHWSIALIKFSV
ncbi:hypothetical protein [Nostoc sp.]|uniref:hypothetical protein n=1 Tax=Nostoc sp. TaxID=1180 RepID=UPI002FF68D71